MEIGNVVWNDTLSQCWAFEKSQSDQIMQDMYFATEYHHGDRNSVIGIIALLFFTICFEVVQKIFSKKKKNDHLDEFSFRLFGKKSLIWKQKVWLPKKIS